MSDKPASKRTKQKGKHQATLAYHVLKSSIEEAHAAIKSPGVKELPKKDIRLLQCTANALLEQITLCLRHNEKGTMTP